MKTELELLKEWIAQQRVDYTLKHFETDEKKLDEINRQQTLLEVQMQILIFEKQLQDQVIESWGKTNDTTEDYMHISEEQRKLFDEVFEQRSTKKTFAERLQEKQQRNG